MHPPPILITEDELPANAIYVITLASGERMYQKDGKVYAVQPETKEST